MKTVTRGEPHDEGLFDFVVKVNLYGTFNVSSIAAAAMAKQAPRGTDKSRGVIINVASVAAFEGQKGQLACTLVPWRDTHAGTPRLFPPSPHRVPSPRRAVQTRRPRGLCGR